MSIKREKAKEILKKHQPTPLEKDIQKEIKEIIKMAEKSWQRAFKHKYTVLMIS